MTVICDLPQLQSFTVADAYNDKVDYASFRYVDHAVFQSIEIIE